MSKHHRIPGYLLILKQVTDTPEASRTYSSPRGNANSTPSSDPPPYEDDGRSVEDEKPEARDSALTQAANKVTSTAQMTYEELKEKLAQAEAQIASYKDSSGLRQRNVKGSSSGEKNSAGEVAQAVKQTVEGVPVQLVALLCLVSFLLAYFFF